MGTVGPNHECEKESTAAETAVRSVIYLLFVYKVRSYIAHQTL